MWDLARGLCGRGGHAGGLAVWSVLRTGLCQHELEGAERLHEEAEEII